MCADLYTFDYHDESLPDKDELLMIDWTHFLVSNLPQSIYLELNCLHF